METAWKCTHVPKSVPKHVYTSSVQGVAKQCSSVQGVSKFVHMLCTNWARACARVHFQAVSKQFPSLGTPTSTAVKGVGLHLLCTQSSNNLYSILVQESHRREFKFPPQQLVFHKEELAD